MPRSPKDGMCLPYDPAICRWEFPDFCPLNAVKCIHKSPRLGTTQMPLDSRMVCPLRYMPTVDTIQQYKAADN